MTFTVITTSSPSWRRTALIRPALRGAISPYAICGLAIATFVGVCAAQSQEPKSEEPKRIALKSGESVELRNYSFVTANCQSIMVGTPVLDVLEGPEELSLALKEGRVIRRDRGCPMPVPGGKVVATAKDVKEPKEAKLTIRLNYKTKDGERQSTSVYIVSIFPGAPRTGDSASPPESTEPASPH